MNLSASLLLTATLLLGGAGAAAQNAGPAGAALPDFGQMRAPSSVLQLHAR